MRPTVVCSSDGAAHRCAISFFEDGLAHDNQRTIHSSDT
jgi:hypothetical protein